jgi:hypothetical protein
MTRTALRGMLTALLIFGVSTAARADDLRESIDRAAAGAAQEAPRRRPSTLVVTGAGLFVTGMAVGLYGFINDRNGQFAEFGEAQSSNKHLGAAGLSVAFAGGVLMFLGKHRAQHAPTVTMGAGGVSVAKTIAW